MPHERILVVDDEKGVVRSCVRILERQGYIASGVTNSQAVPELLRHESFDLLLTDIKMPRIDGLELLRLAKEIDPHLTVVLITGYGTMEDAVTAIRLGAQGFLMKPFEPADLIATVKDNLARRAMIRDSLRLQTLLPLLETNRILQQSHNEALLIHRLLEIARRETGATRLAWISNPDRALFLDQNQVEATSKASSKFTETPAEIVVVAEGETSSSTLPAQVVEMALKYVRPAWVLTDGTMVETLAGQANIIGALLPLVINGEAVGLLTAEATTPLNQLSLDLLSVLAGQLTIMLENVHLFQQTEALRTFNADIIHHMTNGLIAVDGQGYITAFNPAAAAMLGYKAEQVLHQPLQVISQSSDDLTNIFKETLTSGVARSFPEITLQCLDGRQTPVSVSVAPLGSSASFTKPLGAVGVLEDLREIKALETERRRLDRLAALGEMSAVVAHEIRNPIAGIAVGVDYLTRNVPKDSLEFEGVTMIRGEIQRVNRILEDILFIARPTRLKLSSENLAQIIDHVVQRCRPQITESHVVVQFNYAKGLPPLQVDRQRLEQVLTNLVINATQAMSRGGELLLQTELAPAQNGQKDDEVIITIADTGPGIPPEAHQQIFEPFFTTKTRGTGLGLTVARRIIEEHNGTITFDHEAPQGTRFTIRLPITGRRDT
jgi:PAS domain S-box-containing protein